MKKLIATALLGGLPLIVSAQGGWLQSFEENAPSGPDAAVLGQINLGALLGLYYNDIPYGVTQTRVAENDVRLGVAGAGGPAGGYAHAGLTTILSPSIRTLLTNNKTYTVVQAVRVDTTEDDSNPSSSETGISNLRLGLQHYQNADTMIGGSLEFSGLDSDSGGALVEREAINTRLDYVRRLNNEWGFVSRAVFSRGELDLNIVGPGVEIDRAADHLYLQGEFLQTLTPVDISPIPEGWELNNNLGVSFNRVFEEDTVNNFGGPEDGDVFNTGSVWGTVSLAKAPLLNRFSPGFTVGIEHEHSVSDAELIEDDTYLVLGASVLRFGVSGSIFTFIYDRRQGFEGDRTYDNLVLSYSYSFQ